MMKKGDFLFLNQRRIIGYNPKLKYFGRANRAAPTDGEKKLWEEVLRKKQTGYKFLRQKPISGFIVDFYCSKLLLAIEVDGGSHLAKGQKAYDILRTEKLNIIGIKVIRYRNTKVINDINWVYQDIMKEIQRRRSVLLPC